MPLPSPRNKEKKSDFVSRCISDLTEKKEFEDNKQRSAVCYNIFKEAKSKVSIIVGEGDGESLYFADSDDRFVTKKNKKKDG